MGKFQGLLIPEFQAPSSQRALKGGSSQVPSSTVPDSGLEQAKFRESGQVPSSGFSRALSLERMEERGQVLKRDLKFQRRGNERAKSKVP